MASLQHPFDYVPEQQQVQLAQYHQVNLQLAESCGIALVNYPIIVNSNDGADNCRASSAVPSPKEFVATCVQTITNANKFSTTPTRDNKWESDASAAVMNIPRDCPLGYSITERKRKNDDSDDATAAIGSDGGETKSTTTTLYYVQFDSPKLCAATKELLDTVLAMRDSNQNNNETQRQQFHLPSSLLTIGPGFALFGNLSVGWVHDDVIETSDTTIK